MFRLMTTSTLRRVKTMKLVKSMVSTKTPWPPSTKSRGLQLALTAAHGLLYIPRVNFGRTMNIHPTRGLATNYCRIV